MPRQPLEGNRKRFQLKLIEMLGKGFRQKEHHDFVSDVEQSRAAYKINKSEVEYFVVRALLSLPALVNSETFLMTLREILEFYQNTLVKLINGFVPKLECLRAIEDANLECEHLKYKETSAFLVHFLTVAGILDGDTVMQFYRNLQERNSYLASQESFRMMIIWLQDEAAKKRLAQRRSLAQWSEEDEDIPLSHWVMKGIEQALNVKPLCVWAMRSDDRSFYRKYKPLLVLVRKNVAEAANNDPDEVSEEEDNTNDEAQNDNEEDNPEQNYGDVEQSDVEDQDDDEEDEVKDFSDLDSDETDDIPMALLKNIAEMKMTARQ